MKDLETLRQEQEAEGVDIFADQPEQPEEVKQPEQKTTAPSIAHEANFKQLRESKEKAERERDEAMSLLRQIEAAALKNQPEQEEPNPDDLVEWKQVNKYVDEKINTVKNQFNNYQQQTYAAMVESQLKSQYADFDKVVSKENIDALRATEPELAQSLSANPDLYTKAVSAYKAIKRMGIYQENSENQERVKQNTTRPRTMNSVSPQTGDTPLSQANAFANGLTDDLKKQLFKEMNAYRKNF